MRAFKYRLPRMMTGFSVDFLVSGETLHGLCRDFSEAGIRAEFDGPVAVGSFGTLILRHSVRVVRLEAQVAYLEKYQVGLSFLVQTTQEREMALQIMTLLADNSGTY